MTMPGDPVFKVGDQVRDHRGNNATVVAYRVVEYDGKSNRVQVHFEGETEPRKTEFYAGVFDLR